MLEVADLARRYGDGSRSTASRSRSSPGSCSGSSGRTGPARRRRCGSSSACSSPTRGEVRWRGQPVDLATRARFGYMPEERGLYPKMRVRDQLAYFASLHGLARPTRAPPPTCGSSGSGSPSAPGTAWRRCRSATSSASSSRVALVHEPELLVLDEPFSGLDPVGVDVLSGVLRGLADDGVPVCSPRHQLELVERLCESVAIVKDGRLVASGRVDELRSRARARRRVRVRGAGRGRGLARAACPVPRSSIAGRTACSCALRDGAGPEAVLDAARDAGHGHALRARAADARASCSARRWRREPGCRGARRSARRAARDHAEAAREVVPDLDGRHGGDHRARRRDPGAAGRGGADQVHARHGRRRLGPDRRRGQAGARLRRRGEGALVVAPPRRSRRSTTAASTR